MIRLTGLVDIKPLTTEEKWIQNAIKKPGALHKQLGVAKGKKIPKGKLSAAAKKGGKLGKRARLAQTLAKLKESTNLSEEQLAKVNELYVALDLPGREDKDIDNAPRGSLSDTYYRKRRELSKRYKMAKATKSPYLNTMNLEDLDPVGKEDADVDNDGDVDSSDKYLQARRNAIGNAMAVREDVNDMSNNSADNSEDDHEGSMAKADLLAIHKQAGELYNMIGEGEQLEGWVQSKITKAADYISSVYNNMQYEKNKPNSVGSGMGAPADKTGETQVSESYPGKESYPGEHDSVCPECGGVGRHEPGCPEVSSVNEAAPKGWEATVLRMKKHKEIDNPWALAHWMKSKGYHPHAKKDK